MFKLFFLPFIFPCLCFQCILKCAHLQLVAAQWNNGFIYFWHCSGAWNTKLYIISKCLSWQQKPHWIMTVIAQANLLLDRFSFPEVGSNELTLHFYICASCIMYSSNMSLPVRAGIVLQSLRFIQSCRGQRFMAQVTDVRIEHWADETRHSACLFHCWKGNTWMNEAELCDRDDDLPRG